MVNRPYSKLEAIGDLDIVVTSRAVRAILQEHKDYLQKQVNRFVREQDLFKAYGEVCKMDDKEHLIRIFDKKLKELRKEKSG